MRVRWISRHGDCPYGEFLKAEGLGARRGRGIGRVRLRLLRLLRLLLLLGRRGRCASHRGNARRRGGRCPPVPLSTLRNTVSEKSDEAEIANVNLFSFFFFVKRVTRSFLYYVFIVAFSVFLKITMRLLKF